MKSLAGKLVDIRLMVPYGKFNIGQIIKFTAGNGENLEEVVEVSDW